MLKDFYALGLAVILVGPVTLAQELPSLEGKALTREQFEQFINEHPFSTRERMDPAKLKGIDKRDRPDLAWEQDFLRTLDPATGKPEPQRVYQYQKQRALQQSLPVVPGTTGNSWSERGPDNIGGRTRALMWDPDGSNKVWAGGVTGGLWFNNNIADANSSWTKVNDFWDNLSVTCIAYDPSNPDTMYVGTGEGWGAGAAIGAGIFRSTNGGSTWSQLTSTTSSGTDMHYVNDIIVRNESGSSVVYAAVNRMFYRGSFHGDQGLFRSTNHGSTWTEVLPNAPSSSNNYAPADIELDAGNRIWVGTRRNSNGAGGGTILHSDNGTTWTTSYSLSTGRRVELACAPSNQNIIAAIITARPSGSEVVEEIKRTANRGTSWFNATEPADADNGIPNTDFTRGQAWYDLIAAYDPNDTSRFYVGGIDLFMTESGGTSWSQTSKWSNNNNLFGLPCPLVHADQHAFVFKPGSSDTAIIGNDGGVYFSANVSAADSSSTGISPRNKGYNVTQFYAGAIHPQAGNNHMIAGSQDNGTIRVSSAGVGNGTEVRGGDGAYCFIDQNDSNYQIASYVYNTYYLSTNGGQSTFFTQLIRDFNTGSFINPADYDDNQNVLYSARTSSSIQRVKNITGTFSDDFFTVTLGSMATAFTVSPHTTSSTTLFVGTSGGRVYKITGAQGSSPSSTRIDGSSLPSGSISSIDIGGSEDVLLVTLSNFGINSVWFTTNGGSTWQNKDGSSLPDMPIRWGMINPYDTTEVLLATDLGVWSTTDITASTPSWASAVQGLANVRVDMLQRRTSDSTVMAATHGRGVFTGKLKGTSSSVSPPVADFSGTPTTICAGDTVTFTDMSTGTVTSRSWTFTGGNPSSSSASTVQVVYSTSGNKTVSLQVSNSGGSDTETKTNYITVNSTPNASLGTFADMCTTDSPLTLTGGTPSGGTYSGPGVSAGVFNPSTAGAGVHTIVYTVTSGSCTDTAQSTIEVFSSSSISVNAPPFACQNETAIVLSGTPSGGTFSGPGLTGNIFDASSVSTGTKNFTYSVTSPCGTSNLFFRIVVRSFTAASLTSFSNMCESDAQITLTGGSPSGGTYKVNGVVASTFDPGTAGVGTHNVDYIFTDANSCNDSARQTITVSADPVVTIVSISPQCLSNTPFTLTGGSPGTGTYKINGNVATTFDPSALGIGSHTVRYIHTNAGGCTDSASTTVVVNPEPTVTLGTFSDLCLNASSISLSSGSPSGGTYSGTGVSGGSFNPSSAGVGTHSVTYTFTDGNGCTDSASSNIVVKSIPTVNATNDTSICNGNSITLSVTGAVSYVWSPSTGLSSTTSPNPVANPSSTTQYTVVGTGSNSCTNSDSLTLTVLSSPTVTLTNIIDQCEGNNPFTLSNGSPTPGTYEINGSVATTFDAGTLGAGNHTVEYFHTDANGCADSASITVTVHAQPTVTLGSFADVCLNDPVLTLSGGGPTGGNYSGNGVSSGSFTPSNAGVGTHSINYVFTDANSCSDSAQQNITVKSLPTITASADTNLCTGDTIGISASGGTTYSWSPTGGLSSPGSSSTGASPSATTTYTVTGTGSNNCSNTDDVVITVLSLPNVSAGTDQTICDGSTTNLAGSGAANYTWSPSTGLSTTTSPNPLVTISSSLTYQLLGVDANGCANTDTVRITVSPKPVVDAGLDTALCDGESYTMMGSGATTYTWSPSTGLNTTSGPNPVLTVNGNQTYSLIGVNTFGCSDTDAVSITGKSLPNVTFQLIQNRCANDNDFTLNQGQPTGGTYSGNGIVGGSIFSPSSAGIGIHTLTYEFTGTNGCTNDATQTVEVLGIPSVAIVGLANTYCDNDNPVTISTIPANGTLTGPGMVGTTFSPTTLAVGTYDVTLSFTDSNSCTNSVTQSVKIAPVEPVDDIQGFVHVAQNNTYNYRVDPVNGATYSWSVTNGTLLAVANNVASIQWGTSRDGRIDLRQTTLDGCSDSTFLFIHVGTVSIDETNESNRLIVYPNPTDNNVTVRLELGTAAEMVEVILYDLNGKEVKFDQLGGGRDIETNLNLTDLSAGVYTLKVVTEKSSFTQRLVKR